MNNKINIDFENGLFKASLIVYTPYPWEAKDERIIETIEAEKIQELNIKMSVMGWFSLVSKNA